MNLSNFHFEQNIWFLGLVIIPVIWAIYGLLYNINAMNNNKLGRFIDKHLLPHLLIKQNNNKLNLWQFLLLWSAMWSLIIASLAGPRCSFEEIEIYKPDKNLVILLDLSNSMNTEDVKPSRIKRAKQKIDDILRLSQGVNISIIGFAADAHVIAPLTDEVKSIRHLMQAVDTDIVFVQGSNISPALEMVDLVLRDKKGDSKAVLILSDGEFADSSALSAISNLANKNINIYTIGIGDVNGAPVKNHQGAFIKESGNIVISKLNQNLLQEIANTGKGKYFSLNYSDNDIKFIFDKLEETSTINKEDQSTKQWEDSFYIFLLPVIIVSLFWFRRNLILPIFLIILSLNINIHNVNAVDVMDFFRNKAQQGANALQEKEFDKAKEAFDDPYHLGVVHYKEGNYKKAEELFRKSKRLEVAKDAKYNLANAVAKQGRYEEAVKLYEELLKEHPDHSKAQHNLQLVKNLILVPEEKEEKKQKNFGIDGGSDSGDEDEEENKDEDGDQESKGQKGDKGEELSANDSDDGNEENQDNSGENDQDQNQDQDQDNPQDKPQNQDGDSEARGNESKNDDDGHDQDQQEVPVSLKQGDEEQSDADNQQEVQGSFQEGGKSQKDIDANQWLSRISNDPKAFLKNQFYIESTIKGTKENIKPW